MGAKQQSLDLGVSPATLEKIRKKAKTGVAVSVTDPINHLPYSTQLDALASLFASRKLTVNDAAALEAMRGVIVRLVNTDVAPAPGPAVDAACELVTTLDQRVPGQDDLIPGFPLQVDAVVAWGYAADAARFEKLLPQLKGAARLGLQGVRYRFGEAPPAADAPQLLRALARAFSEDVVVPTKSGLAHASDDELEALALRLGSRDAYLRALEETFTAGRVINPWLVARLPAAALARCIATMDERHVEYLIEEDLAALRGHTGSAREWQQALDEVPDERSLHKTLVGLVAGEKLAKARAKIPKPWPLFRSYQCIYDPGAREHLAAALLAIEAALPRERALDFAKRRLAAGDPDAMVALAAHLDPQLAEEALERFSEDDFPEARNRLLAAMKRPAVPRARSAPENKQAPSAIEPGDIAVVAFTEARGGSTSRSCVGGEGGVGAKHVPKHKRAPMEHIVTIDFADVPAWKKRWPKAEALAVFAPDAKAGAFDDAKVVWVPKGGLGAPDPRSIRIALEPRSVSRAALGKLEGYAGGEPTWIHEDASPSKASFLFELSQGLAGAHVNLGEGTLYVFDDGSVVLQN